ncbi:MAG: two pore domain potassium channel family protein, partial [Micromonosporaceae bacterium]|nr:two pore domain potassium channel family protein [Micromonosporaceae bacterium]
HTLVAVLVAVSAAGAVTTLALDSRPARAALALWSAALLTLATAAVLRRILNHRVVSLQTISGALSAYLLIGFLFAALFSAVANLHNGPLFAGGQPANHSTIQYFSFTTMTTVGYGDFAAAGEPTRSLAVLEALIGQIFLVTLVARLVSTLGQQRTPPG